RQRPQVRAGERGQHRHHERGARPGPPRRHDAGGDDRVRGAGADLRALLPRARDARRAERPPARASARAAHRAPPWRRAVVRLRPERGRPLRPRPPLVGARAGRPDDVLIWPKRPVQTFDAPGRSDGGRRRGWTVAPSTRVKVSTRYTLSVV